MKKTMVFIMSLIILFFFCACSITASSNNTTDTDNALQGFKQLPDFDMGQNIYENSNKENQLPTDDNLNWFGLNTEFAPIDLNQLPPFVDIPIQWTQYFNIPSGFPAL